MAYFKLTLPAEINVYGFDYHSHFTGILPVRGKPDEKQPRSLIGLAATTFGDDVKPAERVERAELVLFDYALGFMADRTSNPFARLAAAPNRAMYERAECAAENVYIACVLLLDRFGYLGPRSWSLPITARELYDSVRKTVIAPALAASGPIDGALLKTLRYFNDKIYSSSKFTPFDDCYKMRGLFVKQFCGGDPADYAKWPKDDPRAVRYHAWIDATFDFLFASGIRNTQSAATEDEIPALNARAALYNSQHGSNFKLLVHTPSQYLRDGKLREYLNAKMLPLLTDPAYGQVVGVDLLGAENKVGNYRELFEFLDANTAKFANQFGPKLRSLTLVSHIHCGEGSGFGADSRSLTGYYMFEVGDPDEAFFAAFARYILDCAKAADEKVADTPRGTRGTATPLGLFEELFHNNTLVRDGRALRRFDISSERSRNLAAFNAKRNVMALSETFDSDTRPKSGTSWYQALTGEGTLLSFRLGHDYYYRSYMAAKYPVVAFDTNLGSNAITGASGLFASIESYRINRGFRHLDGYIDTDVLAAAGDAVAYLGSDALTQAQIAQFSAISGQKGTLYEVLDDPTNQAWISTQLSNALGPLNSNQELSYLLYENIVQYIGGNAGPGVQRYQAMTRVYTLFQNWRCYLLGADGQGAEHTDIQDEFLRMLVLLAYSLLPTGVTEINGQLLGSLGNLVTQVSVAYWNSTVGVTSTPSPSTTPLDLELIEGFKAPSSVVALYKRPVAA